MASLYPSSASCCPATYSRETAVLQRRILAPNTSYHIGQSGLRANVRGHDKIKRGKRIMHWILGGEGEILHAFWHWSDQDVSEAVLHSSSLDDRYGFT